MDAKKFIEYTEENGKGILKNMRKNRDNIMSDYIKHINDSLIDDKSRLELVDLMRDIEWDIYSAELRYTKWTTVLKSILKYVESLFKEMDFDVDFRIDDNYIDAVVIASSITTVKVEYRKFSEFYNYVQLGVSYSPDNGFTYGPVHVSKVTLGETIEGMSSIPSFLKRLNSSLLHRYNRGFKTYDIDIDALIADVL